MRVGRRHSVNASRRGSILLLVLIAIVVLTVGAGAYLQLMQNEHFAVRQHGRMQRARALAESGVTYLKVMVAQTPQEIQQQGGLTDNPSCFQALLVEENNMPSQQSRFSVLAPGMYATGLYGGVRFGLEDESAKLNVNSLLADEESAVDRLLSLPGMTETIAEAILDWLDDDDMARLNGAEEQYYQSLDPPYSPRNGPIVELDELLLVRDVTPELLYGLDQNRNLRVDPDELPRGALTEIDNSSGSMNRGWSAYLTLFSTEKFRTPEDARKINLNSANLEQLHGQLVERFDTETANFIIAYRQNGGSRPSDDQDEQRGGGRNSSGGDRPSGGSQRAARSGQGGNQGETVDVSASDLELDFQQQGQTQITSLLDLAGVEVRIQPSGGQSAEQGGGQSGSQQGGNQGRNQGRNNGGNRGGDQGRGNQGGGNRGGRNQGGGNQGGGNQSSGNGGDGQGQNGPTQVVQSPWQEDASSYRELLVLYDYCMPGNLRRVAGRININAASRRVLTSIPGVDDLIADQILNRRQPLADPLLDDQRHAIWLLIDGLVDLELMRQLEPYVTAGGHVYSCQVAGFFDETPTVARLGVILDHTGRSVRLVESRNLSAYGPGFSPSQLGAPIEERR